MRAAFRRSLFAVVCVSLALALPGCQSGTPKVTGVHGRLLDKGQPLQLPSGMPPGDPGVRVTFYPTDEEKQGKEAQQAVVNSDGTFTVPGNDRKGIIPGKYRIGVTLGAFGGTDKLKGAFDPKTSPIVRDVTGNEEIIIDIGKPTG
jgi:hypothetical protein